MEKITAGMIAAARKRNAEKESSSMKAVGEISAIKREVITFLKAEISPIVIITGYNADVLEHELAAYPLLFLKYDRYENAQLLELAQAGVAYLQGKCDQVLFTPVENPLFGPDTIRRLMDVNAPAVAPACEGRGGHPILLSAEVFPALLRHHGPGGIPGACDTFVAEKVTH